MKNEKETSEIAKTENNGVEATDRFMNKINDAYRKMSKIEIRDFTRDSSSIINSYKKEHGKLHFDLVHTKKPLEIPAIASPDFQVPDRSDKLTNHLIVFIKSTKGMLLGVFNYTLRPRTYSQLKKEEARILGLQKQHLTEEKRSEKSQTSEKKNHLLPANLKQIHKEVQQYKAVINDMLKTLKKSPDGKLLLKSMKQDTVGKKLLSTLKNPAALLRNIKSGPGLMKIAAAA